MWPIALAIAFFLIGLLAAVVVCSGVNDRVSPEPAPDTPLEPWQAKTPKEVVEVFEL
jgi:hypothetical protein